MDAAAKFAAKRISAAAAPAPISEDELREYGVVTDSKVVEMPREGGPQQKVARNYLPKIDRPLPHSEDAEKGVISSIMQGGKKTMFLVEPQVGKGHFHSEQLGTMFAALAEMHHDNEPINDLIAFTDYLERTNRLEEVGGVATVTELSYFAPGPANVQNYIEILCEKYKAREAYKFATQVAAEAIAPGNGDALDEMLAKAGDQLRRIQDIGKVASGIDVHGFADLIDFDTKQDADSVLGYRYLCRGGSALVVGQSGIGKSSLAMQSAMMWAQGRSIFGLGPTKGRPLRSLFIQAENDQGDLAEMMQGVMKAFPIPDGMSRADFIAQMRDQMVFVRDTIHTGKEFARSASNLIQKYKPDLVWADPLLSYAGDDISSQKVASEFLRNTLNPIAFDTGIIWMLLHHTGKPSTDPKAKAHWTDHDFSYAAFGSSELVNWARAVMVLRSIGEGRFELRFSKRGKRTGVKEFQDPHIQYDQPPAYTDVVYIEHAKDAIYWEQIAKPEEIEKEAKRSKATGQFDQKFSEDELYELIEKLNSGRKPKEILNVAKEQIGMGERTFWSLWKKIRLAGRVIDRDGRWYANTPENHGKVYAR